MKTCPICGAIAFDDAETCFGCLHNYAAGSGPASGPKQVAGEGGDEPVALVGGDDMPTFVIRVIPSPMLKRADWTCTVERCRTA